MNEVRTKPVVWIIDSQQWPRAYLRALLLERRFDAIGFMELDQALAALNDPHHPEPHIIVFELHGLSPTGDELDTLVRINIPIVALAGRVEINEEWVRRMGWAAMIQRPATIGQIADVIERLTAQSKREKNG